MRVITAYFAFAAVGILSGCGSSGSDHGDAMNAQIEAEVERRLAEIRKAEFAADAAGKAALGNVSEESPAAPDDATVERAEVELCWQDYCPCDPPQGGPDAGLCRMLIAGMHVDQEILAAGAMARDARQQLEEFEAEYGRY